MKSNDTLEKKETQQEVIMTVVDRAKIFNF